MPELILTSIAILAIAIFAFYKWFTINNDYFKKRGYPQMKSSKMPTGNIAEATQYLYYSNTDEKIVGFIDRRCPMFVVRDPETLKHLTIKAFDHFEDHRPNFDETHDVFLGNSLFFMRGEKWRDMRATLSPAFTGNKMRQMFELIVEIADEMTKCMTKEIKKGGNVEWEVKDLVSCFTNDVIATSAFGIRINSMEDRRNDFMLAGEKIRDISSPMAYFKLMTVMLFPRLAKALGLTIIAKSAINFFKPLIFNTMSEREKKQIYRPDMINLLMQVRKGNLQENTNDEVATDQGFKTQRIVKREWTDNELLAQCLFFFGAGFNTVSDLLSFAIYELAIHPEIQERLYEEVNGVNQTLNDKPLNYDILKSMNYLDQVVSETLRKWPPSPLMDRDCVKEFHLDLDGKDVEFKKGHGFYIPIYGFHHDPKYFPQPDVFDPERFNEENKKNIVSGTYIPFGVGPRMCIGNRLALMESKALLYYLMLTFKIEPNAKTDVPLKLKRSYLSLVPSKGIHVQFKPRS